MSVSSKDLVIFFLGQINKMRVHPKAFLKHLEDRTNRFTNPNDNKIYSRGDIPNLEYKTIEGQKAVGQAYNYLLNTPQGQPLQLSYQLCEAAYAIGGKISGSQQQVDIRNYQKDLLNELANNKCQCGALQVIIEYGFRKDRQLVPSIVIDDGNNMRSRRQALLGPRYKYIGLAVHEHRQFDYQLLILLADDVEQIIDNQQAAYCGECNVM